MFLYIKSLSSKLVSGIYSKGRPITIPFIPNYGFTGNTLLTSRTYRKHIHPALSCESNAVVGRSIPVMHGNESKAIMQLRAVLASSKIVDTVRNQRHFISKSEKKRMIKKKKQWSLYYNHFKSQVGLAWNLKRK